MRLLSGVVLMIGVAITGCGGEQPEVEGEPQAEPMAAAHESAAEAGVEGGAAMHGSMKVNRDVNVDPEVVEAFTGVRLEIVDTTTGESRQVDARLGEPTDLGKTGLTVTPLVFVPDFVMDDTGISTRSAEPNNPAAKVRIEESGVQPFEGWLFGELPDVHPFPHDRYRVLLVSGIPAGSGS